MRETQTQTQTETEAIFYHTISMKCGIFDSIQLVTVPRYKFQGVRNHFGDS